MTADIKTLDAHKQPSEYLRAQWKSYAKTAAYNIIHSGEIDDVNETHEKSDVEDGAGKRRKRTGFCKAGTLPGDRVAAAFAEFLAAKSRVDGDIGADSNDDNDDNDEHDEAKTAETVDAAGDPAHDRQIYYHPLLPGLLIIPNLVPPTVQKRLLDRMIHRDLSKPYHQTNMHLHYSLPYPEDGASFFTYPPPANAHSADVHSTPGTFMPKDPSVHRPLSIQQVLDKRLHWVTLGGQYDWTNRVYPGGVGAEDEDEGDEDAEEPKNPNLPRFPRDLTRLLSGLFPDTVAQAAIVNFYTPGDTMMIHRDVSEETDKGLISLSIGCDALFMAAPTGEFDDDDKDVQAEGEDGDEPYILLRLRSGDAIYMAGHDRFAWHGVPKVIKGTCPDFLADWPAGEHRDGRYEAWRGWMSNKRVNFNVRQMRD